MEDLLDLVDENFEGAYLAGAQVIDYVNLMNFPNVNLLKTKDYLLLTPVCIYFRKHSCLLKPLNNQISLYINSGLIKSWTNQYKLPTYKESELSLPKALRFNQISGIVNVCFYLSIASIIVFFLEVLSKRYRKIKAVLDFLFVQHVSNTSTGALSSEPALGLRLK